MGTAGMMPELGSKISLISKADIRYEGRLFTVDPQECTIALANVRSFGTEDRETPYPIMPQPTVYDYILFRGSDIKDIRVVNSVPIPNDPAIMQMHLPPNQMPSQQQQGFPPQSFPMQQQQQQPGGQLSQFGPFGQLQAGVQVPNNMGSSIPQQPSQSQQAQPLSSPNQSQQHQQQGNTTNNLSSTTGQTKKSSELSKIDLPTEKATSLASTHQSNVARKQNNKSQDSRSGTPNTARKSPASDMGIQTNQTHRENNAGGNREKTMRNNQHRNNNQQQRERRDSGRNEIQEQKGGYRHHNQRGHNQQHRGGYNNNNNNRNNQMRGNQHGGGSGRMRGSANFFRPMPNNNNNNNKQNVPQRGGKNQNTLKFENEFDFEQANSKFEELRSQLAKLKVGSEETKNTEQVNGEVEKKDDSGNETGGADHEVEADDCIGYDKKKSFFDNISCEANERSKGKTQRTDWRQERKINSETFGLSMNRRGNMRGRGGYAYRQYNNRPGTNYRSAPSQFRNRNRPNPQNNGGRSNSNQGQQSQNQTASVAAN